MANLGTTHLTLTQQNLEWLKLKLEAGRYSSEEEVVNQGLDALRHADAIARYEREVVVPAYQKYLADPSSAISMEEMDREFGLPDEQECQGTSQSPSRQR